MLKLDDHFWKLFLNETKNFTKPTLIKHILLNDIAILKESLFHTFKTIVNEDDSPYGLWINGENKNDYKDLLKKGINTSGIEDLDLFCNSFFEDYNYGIIGHHNNAYSDKLAKIFYDYLKPLYHNLGTGLKGVDLNTFIGNYGWTPVGIHQDSVGENVIHFHLGSGLKTMYLWSPNTFQTLNKSSFEEKIERADYCFIIEPGDLFFMPYGYYHIGYSPEYSVAITTWFCTPPKQIFQRRIFQELGKDFISASQDMTSFRTSFSEENTIENFFHESFKELSYSPYANLTFREVIKLKIKRHIFSLESSLFYTSPMMLLNRKDTNISDKTIFQIDPYFLIRYFTHKESFQIFIFVRGHEIKMDYDEQILHIIDRLNNTNPFSIYELKQIFNDRLVDLLIHKLVSKEALKTLTHHQ